MRRLNRRLRLRLHCRLFLHWRRLRLRLRLGFRLRFRLGFRLGRRWWRWWRRRGIYTPKPGWALFFAKLVIACALMGATAWYSAGQFDWTAMAHQTLLRIGALIVVIGVSALVYFGALMAMGFRFRDFKRTAR